MAEHETPEGEIFGEPYATARSIFRDALLAAGFSREPDVNGIEIWRGTLAVEWRDPDSGEARTTSHRVQIELKPGFPFRKPYAFPIESEVELPVGRHAAPLTRGVLCLFPETYRSDTQTGWAPWWTGVEFLDRVRTWYVHTLQRDWPPTDRPPDLHMSFPSDGSHPMMLVSDDWTPPAGERYGRFGVWRAKEEPAFAGSPLAGSGAVPEIHEDRLLWAFSLAGKPRATLGAWFRLDREPAPRTTLGGILAEIDRATGHEHGLAAKECARLIGAEAAFRRTPVLALGYPDIGVPGGEAWLFLGIAPDAKGAPFSWKVAASMERAQLVAYETVSITRSALMRRTGPLARAVAGKRVAIFGIGALGSAVALLLARSGVETLHLVDSDRLRPGNAVRHVGSLMQTGAPKTRATTMAILQHAPDTVVYKAAEQWDPARIATIVEKADIVVDATAHQPFSLLLNDICLRKDTPLVHGETMRRAAIGRVRVIRPRRDACLVCYENHAHSPEYPVVPPGVDADFLEEGCGVPTVEAPGVDVESTANWMARSVLWVIQDTLGPRNHCLVVNEEVTGVTGDLTEVGVHWSVFGRAPGCEACSSVNSAAAPG